MAQQFLAKEVNEAIVEDLKARIAALAKKNVVPTLATIRVGENGADISYEIGATKKCNSIGLQVKNVVLPADISEEELVKTVKEVGADKGVHGILLFQPLPEHINEKKVKECIPVEKDVDCATVANLGNVLAGREDCFAYCAPSAVMEMLEYYKVPLQGKNVCVIGAGLVVGRPLSMLLAAKLATVFLCNVFTVDTPAIARQADIVVSACGVPGLITDKYVKPGQIVIDVGTKMVDGKLKGDVDFEKVEPIVQAVTPTPGGVSGVTTTVLAKHVVIAAERLNA